MLAQIADVIIETYATESGDRAGREDGDARRRPRAALAADIAARLRQRRRRSGRRGVEAGRRGADATTRRRRSLAAGVRSVCVAYAGIDAIAARRRIADAVIEAGKYPL